MTNVRKYEKLILDTEKHIWENPETGYREKKTSAYMEKIFTDLGYKITKAENVPGFFADLDTGREGPTVLILAELDALICPEHPEADKETGYVHACGHHAQCAAMAGVAAAFHEEGALSGLCGKIRLCLVPAEELIEIEYRTELKRKGIIRYFGGKSEFLYRGYFDGCDIAFMVHTSVVKEGFTAQIGCNGCIAKRITYKGVAAHAGSAPQSGINALYAASLGLQAINSIRETFLDDDHTRVHPILTSGGAVVNAIPDTATLESYVRGSSFEALARENKKVNRALCGAAVSLGANIEIEDTFGYTPVESSRELISLTGKAVRELGYYFNDTEVFSKGSTDMGDITAVMPALQIYAAGAVGKAHGNNYYVKDKDTACVKSAELQVLLAKKLLENGAAEAKKVIAGFKPRFSSKEEFFKAVDALTTSGERITYENDEIKINL